MTASLELGDVMSSVDQEDRGNPEVQRRGETHPRTGDGAM